MPPKRSKARQQQPIIQSDYEDTDTALPLTDVAASSLAPPPKRTNTELNLTVLRRYCSDVAHIIAIAPFAVLYTFSPETQVWEKCGIEGTLFITQLSGRGRYTAIILNRKSLDNFVTELVSADDVEVTEQYVILQTTSEDGRMEIYGLWIFDDSSSDGGTGLMEGQSSREVVAQTIVSCAMQSQIARETEEEYADGDGYVGEDDVVEEYAAGNGEPDRGQAQVFGMDGAAQVQGQVQEEQAVQQQAGQQIDVMSLFGKSAAPAPSQTNESHHLAPPQPQPPDVQQEVASVQDVPPVAERQPSMFTSTADTDFFRTSASPAAIQSQQMAPPPQQQQQQQQPAQQTQQNALLDLFKSAAK
ncbi:hypothetical protein KC345_g4561 [Hortaea werneckii]|nr:hypothetical protein KC345_g4561 [Hortaea werneckii]